MNTLVSSGFSSMKSYIVININIEKIIVIIISAISPSPTQGPDLDPNQDPKLVPRGLTPSGCCRLRHVLFVYVLIWTCPVFALTLNCCCFPEQILSFLSRLRWMLSDWDVLCVLLFCRPPVLSEVLPGAHGQGQSPLVAVHRVQDLQQLPGPGQERGE